MSGEVNDAAALGERSGEPEASWVTEGDAVGVDVAGTLEVAN